MFAYLYSFLLIINSLFLIKVLKLKLLNKYPLFSIYFFSFFWLNIIGSIVVFYPKLSKYGVHNYFTYDFFYILLIQSFLFWMILPFQLQAPNKFKKLNLDNISIRKNKKIILILSILSFSLVLLFYFLNGLPVFYSTDLSLGNKLLVEERSTFFSNTDNFWIYEIGFYTLPQIISVMLFVNYRITNKLADKVKFYFFLFISVVLSLSFLHKTPLVLLFFCLFMAQILFFKKLSLKLVFKYVILFFVLIGIGYIIAFSGNEINDMNYVYWGILNRIFGVYPLELAVTTKIVEESGFFYGMASPNFFGLLSGTINLSELIHYYIFNFKGNAPAPAIGYAYANYGYFGVIFNPILIVLTLNLYNNFIFRLKNKIFSIAIFCLISVKVVFLSMTSMFDTILNPRDIVVLIMILLIYKITNH